MKLIHLLSAVVITFTAVILTCALIMRVQWMWWPCSITSGSRGGWVNQMVPPVNLMGLLGTQPSRQRVCCCTSLHRPPVPHTSAMSPCLEEAASATIRCVYHHPCCLAWFLHLVVNLACLQCVNKNLQQLYFMWSWKYYHDEVSAHTWPNIG